MCARVHSQESENLRRSLNEVISHSSANVFSLKDPRTVVEKGPPQTQTVVWSAINGNDMPRPLNILSLGTSQTYGHGLENKDVTSYPYLITPYPDHVDNLALPATAADHPSLCLESMIPNADTKSYDIILFEYTFNQSDGTTFLLKRLHERFPQALIIFVNIWNVVSKAVVQETGQGPRTAGFNPNLNWVWKSSTDTFSAHLDYTRAVKCGAEICHLQDMLRLLDQVNGVSFTMPRPDTPREALQSGWFAPDWHHLTQQGHRFLASTLARFIATQPELWKRAFKPNKPLGSWRGGDKCYGWAYSGVIPSPFVEYSPTAQLMPLDKKDQYALLIDPVEGATITFLSDFDRPVPVALGYNGQGYPHIYPMVLVTLNNNFDSSVQINPDITRGTRANPRKRNSANVHSYTRIGDALPGRNTLTIHPLEYTSDPFEVISIYLCGACLELQNGHMGWGDLSLENAGLPFDTNQRKQLLGYNV